MLLSPLWQESRDWFARCQVVCKGVEGFGGSVCVERATSCKFDHTVLIVRSKNECMKHLVLKSSLLDLN